MFKDMKEKNIEFDVSTANAFIDSLCYNGKMEEVEDIFQELFLNEGATLTPDVITLTTIITGYSKIKHFTQRELYSRKVEEILKLMKDKYHIEPNELTLNSLMSFYNKIEKFDESLKIYQSIKQPSENKQIYATAIRACQHTKNIDLAWSIYEELLKSGLEPNVVHYGSLLSVDMKNIDFVNKVIHEMVDIKKIKLTTPVIYNTILNCFIKNKNGERVKYWFQHMHTSQVKPTDITYSLLIEHYYNSEDWRGMVSCLK
eukprot:UN31897